jgi:N-methylhydantoinase B/oxoprolinase/acetone carboxylase alpha subunit
MQLFSYLLLYALQDTFLLLTPGGGGYGRPPNVNNTTTGTTAKKPICSLTLERGSVYNYRMLQESV